MRAKGKSNSSTLLSARKHDKNVSTVKQLKRKYDNLPLSYLYGIGDEIDFQCPLIDEYIERIESCRDSLQKAKRARTIGSKNAHIYKAIYQIEKLDSNLDEVTRENFSSLREYAKKWKLFAIRILDSTKTPEKFMIK